MALALLLLQYRKMQYREYLIAAISNKKQLVIRPQSHSCNRQIYKWFFFSLEFTYILQYCVIVSCVQLIF